MENDKIAHDYIKECMFFIRHYLSMARQSLINNDDLVKAYLLHDHYMLHVAYWQDMLDKVFDN